MFHISLLAVPVLCKSSLSESACIRKEREIVCDVVGMEQLEMADAPPASSCPSLYSAGGSFSPPHLRLSFLVAFLLPIPSSIPPSKAVHLSVILMMNISKICFLCCVFVNCTHVMWFIYISLSGVSLEGIIRSVVCKHACLCACVYLSAANLTQYGTHQPNICCAHVWLGSRNSHGASNSDLKKNIYWLLTTPHSS